MLGLVVPCDDNPILCFLEIDHVLQTSTRQACAASADAFAALTLENIAPIICSGQTDAELRYLMAAMDVWHPFIVEDGSAVCIPRGYFGHHIPEASPGAFNDVIEFNRAYPSVTDTVSDIAKRLDLDIVRLTRCSASAGAARFGFTPTLTARALQRKYGEVFQLRVPNEFALARLLRALRGEHLRCTRRGQNVYVVANQGGVAATAALREVFEQHFAGVRTVGLVGPQSAGIAATFELTCGVECRTLREVAQTTLRVAHDIRTVGKPLSPKSGLFSV